MTIMRPPLHITAPALWTILVLGGCDTGSPTEPPTPDLALEDQITLELLADPSTVETALELSQAQTSAANRKGLGWGAGSAQRTQAELHFREARNALAQGDLVRARKQAREARRLVAEGIEEAGGPQAILGMVERLESLPLQIAAEPEVFQISGKLGLQIGQIAVQARNALLSGDRIRAGSLGVLGEQAFLHQVRQGNREGLTRRARLAVALAGEAVDLAERILGQAAPLADAESGNLLDTAKEFLARAERALAQGQEARAAHLAHMATWWALKAVVLPGGITDEEARFIHSVADELLQQATAAVESDPTEANLALLARATRLFHRGEESLSNGVCRGLGALWQSAVLSSYLIG